MPAESAQKFEALEAQAAALMEAFTNAGYEPVAPSIIQPAGIFLDRIGEALRGRTYVFTDPDGEELCLRPDLTVPTCRLYLERHPDSGRVARYCYNGPAFRFQPGGIDAARPREFRQAGIENFGMGDKEKAEAEVLSLVITAVQSAGLKNFKLKFGDLGLFLALLDALDIPERWRMRLKHHFWRPATFHDLLMQLIHAGGIETASGAAAMLAKQNVTNLAKAEKLVALHFEEKKIPVIGTRQVREITERLLDQAADLRADPLSKETANLIEDYLAIAGPSRAAGARIADLSGAAGIDLGPALAAYMRRLDLFAEAGLNISTAQFSAEFGRNLEYYTGIVYQLEIPELGVAGEIAGGGRYDGLVGDIGASDNVSAVGSAIHTERLLAAVDGAPT